MKNLIVTFFLISNFCFGQDLKSSIQEIKNLPKEVKLSSETITQEISSPSPDLATVLLKKTFTTAKGKSNTEEYTFDLSFMDISLIERNASKSEIIISISTERKLKLVQAVKDGLLENFTNSVDFHVNNADEARTLETALKNAIKAARTAADAQNKNIAANGDLFSLIKSSVKSFDTYGLEVNQELNKDKLYSFKSILDSKVSEKGKIEELSSEFSWANLSPSDVEIFVKGKTIGVTAKSLPKNNFIKTKEDGKTSFGDEILLYTETPKEAKVLVVILKKHIQNSLSDQDKYLEKFKNGGSEGLKGITDFEVNDLIINQSASADCFCNYKLKTTKKGKSTELNYSFNWSDLTDFTVETDKEYITLSAKTLDKQPFILEFDVSKDKKSYQKNIEIPFENPEKAREVLAALPNYTKKCKQDLKPESATWLQKTVNDFEDKTFKQDLNNEDKSWTFKVIENTGKKNIENIYEFNIQDIDVSQNEIIVEKQNIGLSLVCNNKEKLIKLTKDGKPSFTNELIILANSTEEVKKINSTIKALIGTKPNKKS